MALPSCTVLQSENRTKITLNEALVTVSNELDAAEKNGDITSEDELRYQKLVLKGHDILSGQISNYLVIPECREVNTTRSQCADNILGSIEAYLKEVKENSNE